MATPITANIDQSTLTTKNGGTNEFGVVLGDRFMVSAKGNGVNLDQLRSAVSGLDLGKLESMKDVGVQKTK